MDLIIPLGLANEAAQTTVALYWQNERISHRFLPLEQIATVCFGSCTYSSYNQFKQAYLGIGNVSGSVWMSNKML